MWNRFASWLRDVPIGDEVDRRNAPTMQLLLILVGCIVPLNAAYYIFIVGLEFRPGWAVDLATDLAISTMAWVSVALIRRGRFRLAIKLFLATMLASAGAAYAAAGFQPSQTDKLPVLLLALGGLVLGRRALWTIFALLMAIFALGMLTDVTRAQRAGHEIGDVLSAGPPTIIGYFIIAIILDRTIAALRESLAESEAIGRELRQEMAERERAQTLLIQAQKMEATGRLAAGIAHDFGNLLNVITGFARQRDAGLELGGSERLAALEHALEGVETAAARGIATTRKLLTFNRSDALNVEWFDPNAVLRELQPMLRQLFPAEVGIDFAPSTKPLRVRLDRGEFELMILNIAANARDAMPAGGRFGIALSSPAPDLAEIALRDTGHGMAPEVRARIFEPFFSTKPASDGSGLGLAVTHDLVRIAGGTIDVESAPGAGTCFRIRLPAAAAAGASPGAISRP